MNILRVLPDNTGLCDTCGNVAHLHVYTGIPGAHCPDCLEYLKMFRFDREHADSIEESATRMTR
jgi:hypothetical protein